MRHLPGQAALRLWVYTHRLITFSLALLLLGLIAAGALAWRLSQGPLEITWAARRLEAAINNAAVEGGRDARLTIGGAALVWEGFRAGVDRPLDIRLNDIQASDATGAILFAVPQAEISLSIRALLFGRVEPRAIELTGPHLRIHRAADGTTTIDLAALMEPAKTEQAKTEPARTEQAGTAQPEPESAGIAGVALAELARAPETDIGPARETRLAQLRRVVVRQATLTVVDRQLGTIWRATDSHLSFDRRAEGGAEASAAIGLTMGGESARLRLTGRLDAGGLGGRLDAELTPLSPAALARVAPALAPLGMLDAAVSLSGEVELGPGYAPRGGRLRAVAAPGAIRLGEDAAALREGVMEVRFDEQGVRLGELRATIQARPDGAESRIAASGNLRWGNPRREGDAYVADLEIGIDRFNFTDLAMLWPVGAANGARRWVTQNATAGLARDARVRLGLRVSPDFSEIGVTGVGGGLEADDLTIHWLRPVPPFERARARLRLIDTDSLEIETDGGRQRLESPRGEAVSGIALKAGRFHVSGLSKPDQIGTIETDISGPIADVLAVLRHPRLRLLDRAPVELRDPGGQLSGRISVVVPLENAVAIDDIRISAKARLEQARLARIVAGRDLDQGALELEAGNDGMRIAGRAHVAAIPTQFTFDMDFRAGPPGQIVQRVSATARADERQLAAAVLDPAGYAVGPGNYQITHTQRRDGVGEVRINADLRDATLAVPPLGWRKPPGVAATAEARLRLNRDRILGLDDIQINGAVLSLRARMDAVEGRLSVLHLDRVTLGATQGRGTVTFRPGGGVTAMLRGEHVDLTARLAAPTAADPAEASAGPRTPWSVDAEFASAQAASGVRFTGVSLRAENEGGVMRRLHVEGKTGEAPFSLAITPEREGRRLTARAADAGALLRGLDLVHRMNGGVLQVNGTYDDRAPDRPLTGNAEITEFRIANAPALARLLQAMTLYGLLEMAQGPGLGFTRLVAPFRLTDASLELRDARAFSPSLGITLKGRVDRKRDALDMDGTFVPAHFFNSLLGDLPMIGRLFSPERGGGLLAFNFSLKGPLNDPQVAVNPLSALTPGFLRGLFSL